MGTQQSLEVHFLIILRFVADLGIIQMEELKKKLAADTIQPVCDRFLEHSAVLEHFWLMLVCLDILGGVQIEGIKIDQSTLL